MIDREVIEAAARVIDDADALLIAAGAGMGVDSGLPDFRGPEGFWRAYPAIAKLGLRFEEMANPRWFKRDPALAWGFYGHRLNLYRATQPHAGHSMLLGWASTKPGGYFVYTSNVDGHFERAGFESQQIVECHGSLSHLQCVDRCCDAIWTTGDLMVNVEESTLLASDPLPECRACGALARPNILMFGDGSWIASRSDEQLGRLNQWVRQVHGSKVAVIECGAGTGVPTVRLASQRIAGTLNATIVRINLREPNVPSGQHIGIAGAALATISDIDRTLCSHAD